MTRRPRERADPYLEQAEALWYDRPVGGYAGHTTSRIADALRQAAEAAARAATAEERSRCAALMEDWVGLAFGERGEEAAAVIRGETHA